MAVQFIPSGFNWLSFPTMFGTADVVTMMAWVNPFALPAGGAYYNVLSTVNVGETTGIGLSIFNNAGTSRWNLGTNLNDFVGATTPALNTWAHATITRNGNAKVLYLNGVSHASGSDTNTPGAVLYLGAFGAGVSGACWDGAIEHARVWKALLSIAEIRREMRSPVAVRRKDLACEYRLRSIADELIDTGGRNRKLTLTGTAPSNAGGVGALTYPVLSVDESPWLWGASTAGGTTFTKSLGGTVTPAGLLIRNTTKLAAGTITPAAAVARSVSKPLAGVATSAGALVRQAQKALAGTVTSSGALSALKTLLRTFTGTLTPAGALSKQVSAARAGTVTSAGALTRVISRVVAGTLTPAGALVRSTAKALAGATTPTGLVTTIKVVLRTLTGTVTPAGAVTRRADKTASGTVSLAGALTRAVAIARGGTLTPAATLAKAIARILTGTLTSAGSLSTLRAVLRTMTGTVTSSGGLRRQMNKALGGSVTPAGSVRRQANKPLAGAVTLSGGLAKSLARTLSGLVTTLGHLIVSTLTGNLGNVSTTAAVSLNLSHQVRSLNVTHAVAATGTLTYTMRRVMG